MNAELTALIRTFLTEAEASGDVVVTSPEGQIPMQLAERIEGIFRVSFTVREADGIRSLIREALWGASSFYDSEMKDTLVGLSEAEFKVICQKLEGACE